MIVNLLVPTEVDVVRNFAASSQVWTTMDASPWVNVTDGGDHWVLDFYATEADAQNLANVVASRTVGK